MKRLILHAATVVLLAAQSNSVEAQVAVLDGPSAIVDGSGNSVLEKLPDTMCLQVSLLAKAGTLKEALDLLRKRVETAKEHLATLGADKSSIQVGEPKMTTIKSTSPAQPVISWDPAPAPARPAGRKPRPAAKEKPPIVVAVDLKAEWKLSAKTGEELLLATYPLQEKIKAADLAGAAEVTKLTPEEEELAEEAQSGGPSFSSMNEPKPGEPMFFYVARFSSDEVDKALAEAYQNAKADAERSCKASRVALGPLTSVGNSVQSFDGSFHFNLNFSTEQGGAGTVAAQYLQRKRKDANTTFEATALQPEMVKYPVSIQVSFYVAGQHVTAPQPAATN